MIEPTLEFERELFAQGAGVVIGCDEVGRGAIAGPVAVGVALILADCAPFPPGLRDSKLLSEPRRVELAPRVASWASAHAVGLASADEVDGQGIITGLGLAAVRAIAQLAIPGDAVVILDGSHDWLTPALRSSGALVSGPRLRVVTRVKADQTCAAVSAASVLAKVHRDGLMIAAHDQAPVYGWAGNKGYASPGHYAAIDEHGPHPLHRRSWLREPGLFAPGLLGVGDSGDALIAEN